MRFLRGGCGWVGGSYFYFLQRQKSSAQANPTPTPTPFRLAAGGARPAGARTRTHTHALTHHVYSRFGVARMLGGRAAPEAYRLTANGRLVMAGRALCVRPPAPEFLTSYLDEVSWLLAESRMKQIGYPKKSLEDSRFKIQAATKKHLKILGYTPTTDWDWSPFSTCIALTSLPPPLPLPPFFPFSSVSGVRPWCAT